MAAVCVSWLDLNQKCTSLKMPSVSSSDYKDFVNVISLRYWMSYNAMLLCMS